MTLKMGFRVRNEVLQNSLLIEYLTSALLASLLGIDDHKNSKSLGNQGGTLSFSQKVNLLIEIGAIPKDDKNKFQAFMEIRNQFVHNIDANSYVNCFSEIKKTERFILKKYPQDNTLSTEKQLQSATRLLGSDVLKRTGEITDKLKEKIRKDVESEISEISNKAFLYSITKVGESFDKMFEDEIMKSKTFSTKRLKGLGNGITQLIMGVWKKKFNDLNEERKAKDGSS